MNRKLLAWSVASSLAVGISIAAEAQEARFAEPTTLVVDPARSYVLAVTGVEGALSFLGHRHAILATSFETDACFDLGPEGRSKVVVTIPTRSLRIDTERGRQLADLGEGLDPGEVAELQEKMLGPEYLAADQHEQIRLEATRVVERQPGEYLLEGNLTLRGRTNQVRVPVEIEELEGDALRVTGSFPITHAEYGMEPESVAGVVQVANEIELSFSLHAVPRPGC